MPFIWILPVLLGFTAMCVGATLIQSALYDNWESWPDARFSTCSGRRLVNGSRARRSRSIARRGNRHLALEHRGIVPDWRGRRAAMFARDGGRDADDNPTHPRASGTFARILGHYVRDQQVLSLPDAIRRITIEPARRLEARVPEMRDRGRIRVGAYADITAFDPAKVTDRSTYSNAAAHSEGITH